MIVITNLHDMNKKHEGTSYCAFDDNRKFNGTKIAFSFMLKAA